MLVPDQVRDDGSGVRNIVKSMDFGLRRNDVSKGFQTYYESINSEKSEKFFRYRYLIPNSKYRIPPHFSLLKWDIN